MKCKAKHNQRQFIEHEHKYLVTDGGSSHITIRNFLGLLKVSRKKKSVIA